MVDYKKKYLKYKKKYIDLKGGGRQIDIDSDVNVTLYDYKGEIHNKPIYCKEKNVDNLIVYTCKKKHALIKDGFVPDQKFVTKDNAEIGLEVEVIYHSYSSLPSFTKGVIIDDNKSKLSRSFTLVYNNTGSTFDYGSIDILSKYHDGYPDLILKIAEEGSSDFKNWVIKNYDPNTISKNANPRKLSDLSRIWRKKNYI